MPEKNTNEERQGGGAKQAQSSAAAEGDSSDQSAQTVTDIKQSDEIEQLRENLAAMKTELYREERRINLGMFRLAWLGFVIASIGIIVSAAQWWTMKEQLELTWRQVEMAQNQVLGSVQSERRSRDDIKRAYDLNKDMVDTARLNSKNTELIASSAGQSVRATQASIRLDQRAWVGVKTEAITVIAGKPFHADLQITNTGKTPALDFHGFTRAESVPRGRAPDSMNTTWRQVQPGVTWSRGTLYPGSTVVGSVDGGDIVSSEGIDAVMKGSQLIYVRCVMEYIDIFGKPHRMAYCGIVNRTLNALEQCEFGNFAD